MRDAERDVVKEIRARKHERDERRNKRRMKKAVISAVTALCILVGTAAAYTGLRSGSKAEAGGPAAADVRETAGEALSGKTVILHSNDVHGAVDGYAKIASIKKDLEADGAEVVVADAGGYSDETPTDDSFDAIDGFRMMRVAGYNVATFGESEFARGYEGLRNDISGAKIRLICANALKDDKTIVNPDYIYETAARKKIGFIGLTSPASCDGIEFLSGDDLYACAKSEVESVRNSGADTVIVLSYLGDGSGSGVSSQELYNKTEGIDFIIDGHTNAARTEGENGEPIQSAGEGFAYIGVIVIGADGKIEDHYIVPTDKVEADESVQTEADKIKENTATSEISSSSDTAAAEDAGIENTMDQSSDNMSVTENKISDNKDNTSDKENDSVVDNKSAEDKKAAEENGSKEENKAEENGTAGSADDQKKVEDQNNAAAGDKKTAEDDKAAEDNAAAKDNKAAEDNAAAKDNATVEDNKSADEQNAVEEQKTADEQGSSDELASLNDGKYEVVKGDCLWNIAKKYLGDGSRWGEIYELNKGQISNPSLIYVGQQLVLPPG